MPAIHVDSVRPHATSSVAQNPPLSVTVGGVTVDTRKSLIAALGTVGDYYQVNVGVQAKGSKPVALRAVTIHEVDRAGHLGPAVATLSGVGVTSHFTEQSNPRLRTDYYAIPVGASLDVQKRYALVSTVAVEGHEAKVGTPPFKINTDDV